MNAVMNPVPQLPLVGRVTLSVVAIKLYLTFILGGEMFSIGILSVKEIVRYANLTEVPMMPACIRGVINLRGAVVPVMDLSNRFGMPSTPVLKSICIVIIKVESLQDGKWQNVGVVVDALQAVLEILATEVERVPSFGAKIRSDFFEGTVKIWLQLEVLAVMSVG
jgi:purine-binding chemotaxis protein CheW